MMDDTNTDSEDEFLHLLHDYIPTPMKYKQLLDCILSEDIKTFKNLVEQGLKSQPKIDVNHVYQDRSAETCLDIACKNGLLEFVQFLLEKRANVNRINEIHNRGPIHFATENEHTDVLSVLLDEPTINPNLAAGHRTALHMAVKRKNLQCVELLLEKGASPNIVNHKGQTALHMAAMEGEREMVNLILQKSKHAPDLDFYKDYNDQTARDVLEKKMNDIPLPPAQKRSMNVRDLNYFLNANDEKNFLKCLEIVENDVVNNEAKKLIEMAADRKLKVTITELLKRVKGTGCNLERAATLAIQSSSADILRQILNTDAVIGNNLLLSVCLELGMPGNSEDMSNRLECLKLILDRKDVDVRCTDKKGNTPLHYAARADCREAVTLLLEKGSYIGQMNNCGAPPVADISVSTLSQYFDDCIQTRKDQTTEYTIEFNYKSLMPHDTVGNAEYKNKSTIDHQKREMDIFQYIADNSNLKYLLKHPLLSSFLYLKWHRIRHILYLNFAFYVLVYLLLNAYILNATYQHVDTSNVTTYSNVLSISTFVAMNLLAIREILQLISTPCHYMSNFENLLEMILVILWYAIFLGAGAQVAAVIILLSAWELVVLIGQYPRMSTGIEMFKTVSLNFMRFLFLYALLILAFAMAFFTLFKDSDNDNFPDPGHSLFKTIIMLTGEFDADDIPFVSYPIFSHLVFVLFVFFIAIVLFNLLNGLAVSDTADILGKAELVGLIARIRRIAYIESVAVRGPTVHGPHCLLCHGFLHSWGYKPLAFLVKKILLFPSYLKSGKLYVKLQNNLETYDNRIYYKKRTDHDSKDEVFSTFNMDPHIIKQAKKILSKRGQESDTEKMICELRKVKDILSKRCKDTKNVFCELRKVKENLDALKEFIENNNLYVRKDDEN